MRNETNRITHMLWYQKMKIKMMIMDLEQYLPRETLVDLCSYVRVVAIMECTVCNAHQGFQLGVMRVLAVTFKKAQSCNEVSFLHEMACVWQSKLLLLLGLHFGGHRLVTLDGRSWSREHFTTIIALI